MFQMAGSLDPTKVLKTGDTMTGNLIGSPLGTPELKGFSHLSYDGTGGLYLSSGNVGNTALIIIGTGAKPLLFPVQAPTASAPPYAKGGTYFDTTQNKLMVAEGADWQTKGNFNNLLAPLTPTFANWTQNPGSLATITDELITDAVLNTNGIGQAGNNTIIWDLGTSKRRYFNWQSDQTVDFFSISDNGTNYYRYVSAGKFRFLKYTLPGALTVTTLTARCYSLE